MSDGSCGLELPAAKLTECPVCENDLKDPRLLACLHTVCLPCLESFCDIEETSTGWVMLCPQCNSKTPLNAETWMAGLRKNTFVEGLVKLKQASEVGKLKLDEQMCEVCSRHDDSSQTTATKYCVDCRQKLCERCSRPHRLWRGGGHKVVELGEEVNADILRTASSYCDQHRDELLKMFCKDCKANMCLVCFALKHRQHDCQVVEDVAVEFKEQLELDVRRTRERMEELRNEVQDVDQSSASFRQVLDSVELEIMKKGEELKKDVDKRVDELVLDVQKLWKDKDEEFASNRESLKMSLAKLENYVKFCEELSDKGSSCEVTGLATDLHSQAGQLLETCAARDPIEEIIVCFRPFQHDMTKLVGYLNRLTFTTTSAGASGYKTTGAISSSGTPSPDPVSPAGSSRSSAFSTPAQRTITSPSSKALATASIGRDSNTHVTRLSISRDQWSATNPEGKRKYSRQFLLQLQHSPFCRIRPQNLPTNIDIALTEPPNCDWSDRIVDFNNIICKYRFPFNAEQQTATTSESVQSSRASRPSGRRDHSRSKTPAKQRSRDRYGKN